MLLLFMTQFILHPHMLGICCRNPERIPNESRRTEEVSQLTIDLSRTYVFFLCWHTQNFYAENHPQLSGLLKITTTKSCFITYF